MSGSKYWGRVSNVLGLYTRSQLDGDNAFFSKNSRQTKNFASNADLTLNTSTECNAFLVIITDTGVVLLVPRNVILPTSDGYTARVVNLTLQTLTFKTAAGTGVAVATLQSALVSCDGTNIL